MSDKYTCMTTDGKLQPSQIWYTEENLSKAEVMGDPNLPTGEAWLIFPDGRKIKVKVRANG